METNYTVKIERQFKGAEKEKYNYNYYEDYGAALNKYLNEVGQVSGILAFEKTVTLSDSEKDLRIFSMISDC